MPPKTRSRSYAPRGAAKRAGATQARLFPQPLRPLSRHTSRGYEVADFADIIGEPLSAWQRWAVIRAMELLPGGQYRFRVVLIMVARQNGKSHLKRIVSLWRLYMDDDARLVLGTAQDVAQASYQWKLTLETIQACPRLERDLDVVRRVNGQESFTLKSGAEYKIRATNENAGRGLSVDELNIDELRTQKDWRAWAALSKTTMARPNPQTWCMSNAGADDSIVLNQLRDSVVSGRDPSICLLEWSAPDGCELDDWKAIRQANPGLGQTVSEAAVRSALGTDPPAIFRTEVLCQHVDALEGAVDAAAWKACGDPAGTMDEHRRRLAASFDISLDGKHATLAVAARRNDGKIRTEIVKAWASTEEARAELPELLGKVAPVAFGWFPSGPAAALAPMLRDLARGINRRGGKRQPGQLDDDGELAGQAISEACQGLADLVKGHQVVHGAQPLLDAHVNGSRKLMTGDGWRFTRRGGGRCDAAYACAGSVYLALTLPPAKVARIRMLTA